MEKETRYEVIVTPEGEEHYFSLLEHLLRTHSKESADRKSDEILEKAFSLSLKPKRGKLEEKLSYLNRNHRYLVYHITKRKTVKIIYFIDELKKEVYITDFFPTLMNPTKMGMTSR